MTTIVETLISNIFEWFPLGLCVSWWYIKVQAGSVWLKNWARNRKCSQSSSLNNYWKVVHLIRFHLLHVFLTFVIPSHHNHLSFSQYAQTYNMGQYSTVYIGTRILPITWVTLQEIVGGAHKLGMWYALWAWAHDRVLKFSLCNKSVGIGSASGIHWRN